MKALTVKSFECSLSQDTRLKVRRVAFGRGSERTIVLLQDSIDSHLAFRELPELLSQKTDAATVLQYDRAGQGDSTGFVLGHRPGNDFPFRESERLTLLLQLLKVNPRHVVLVGYGDGAAICMAHAATAPVRVGGLVMMSPRVVAEQKLIDAVAAMQARRESVLAEMKQHGDKAPELLDAFLHLWQDASMTSMADFDLRPLAKELRCPTLLLHNVDDEFTSEAAQIQPLVLNAPPGVLQVEIMQGLAPGRVPFLAAPSKSARRSKRAKEVVSHHVVSTIARFATMVFSETQKNHT